MAAVTAVGHFVAGAAIGAEAAPFMPLDQGTGLGKNSQFGRGQRFLHGQAAEIAEVFGFLGLAGEPWRSV